MNENQAIDYIQLGIEKGLINDIYIGLENIVSHTGEFISTSDKQTISSACMFKKGHMGTSKNCFFHKFYELKSLKFISTKFLGLN